MNELPRSMQIAHRFQRLVETFLREQGFNPIQEVQLSPRIFDCLLHEAMTTYRGQAAWRSDNGELPTQLQLYFHGTQIHFERGFDDR